MVNVLHGVVSYRFIRSNHQPEIFFDTEARNINGQWFSYLILSIHSSGPPVAELALAFWYLCFPRALACNFGMACIKDGEPWSIFP